VAIAETFDDPTDGRTRTAASPDWMSFAICRGRTVLFFPHRAERPEARARREAKAERLCRSCPVSGPCRTYARANREYGFWAGESEEDRHLAGFTVSAPIGVSPARRRISG
jgi:WhiB family redox-sensing transcriptional regulator